MTPITANFLISQLRCAKRNPQSRRWEMQDKVLALSILKRSLKCYNSLRKVVALRSQSTLLDFLKKIPFSVGINNHLLIHIKKTLVNSDDKMCVLLFDEMDIKEHFAYDISKDRMIGYEDFGREEEISVTVASKALVFMCQGLTRKWKQPVAYYFCNKACNASNLIKCIKEVAEAPSYVGGLDVIAIVCDMGSNNVKALKDLKSTLEDPFIYINEKKIFTIFDPPHLLKCTVALFRKYNVQLPVSINNVEMKARWFSDIIKAHEIDKEVPTKFRSMFKLTSIRRYAMKISIAAQTLSRTVGAYLYGLVSRGDLEQLAIATATFAGEVDELFDSFNGTCLNASENMKPLKCAVTERSET